MTTDQWMLVIIALCAGGYALYQGMVLLALRGKVAQTTGTITDITTVNKNGGKGRNSAWASFCYKVDGRMIYSANRIQVPMTSERGGRMTVRYQIDDVERLVAVSYKRVIVGVVVAVGCFVAMLLV